MANYLELDGAHSDKIILQLSFIRECQDNGMGAMGFTSITQNSDLKIYIIFDSPIESERGHLTSGYATNLRHESRDKEFLNFRFIATPPPIEKHLHSLPSHPTMRLYN